MNYDYDLDVNVGSVMTDKPTTFIIFKKNTLKISMDKPEHEKGQNDVQIRFCRVVYE